MLVLLGIFVFLILLGVTVLNLTYVERVVITSFPTFPGSTYISKTVAPGCMNKTTEQPGCVETRYQWNAGAPIKTVTKWFSVNVFKTSWQCIRTFGQLLPSEKNVIFFSCNFNNASYQVFLYPKSVDKTTVILIVSL